MNIIEIKNLSYTYDGASVKALDDITLSVREGEFIAIVGANGCGKSTLAKHINALIPLEYGKISVAGFDAGNRKNVWDIRRHCAMVFQNPDNQFVSSIAQEDIAFGLENYDYPEEEIPKRVSQVLSAVGLAGFEKSSPQLLSGGQKQRLAIAGVLAINPDIMIFDEVTSMLDAQGRKEVLDTIAKLHRAGKTIIMITHYIEETVFADRVAVMKNGRINAVGKTRDILCDRQLLDSAGLIPPLSVRLYFDLKSRGIDLGKCPINNEEFVSLL